MAKEYVEREATCGDCLHADVCESNPLLTEFSRENPAYCVNFVDAAEYIEREALMLHIAGVKAHLRGDSEWISGYRDALQAVGETVQNFSAADVVERKRGEWVDIGEVNI